MTDDDGICGSTNTTSDEPCQNPAGDDGRCWIPTHTDPDAENPHGRPSKLDLQRQEQIASVVEDGKSLSLAARKAGIAPSTAVRWLHVGEEEDAGPYQEFYERLTRATGHGQDTWESMLLEAAEDDPATIMAVLKTQFRDTWGDVDRGEQSGGLVVDLGDAEEFEVDPETLEVVDGND